jgi:hypothetical protein
MVEVGMVTSEMEGRMRAEAAVMIERIERRTWPYDEDWASWRPQQRWPVPKIADHWPTSVATP